MKTLLRVLAGLALLLCVSSGRAAAPAPAIPRPVGPTQVALAAQDPMAVELQREIERSQQEYGVLFQRLAASRSEKEAFEVQEDMAQGRVALQVALLRIQAAYAHRAHRERLAARLEQLIDDLIAPQSRPDDSGL